MPLFRPEDYIAHGFMLLHCTRTIAGADDAPKGVLIIGLLTALAVMLSTFIAKAQRRVQSSVEDD